MLGDHCLTFKAAKFQFRNIWPYLSWPLWPWGPNSSNCLDSYVKMLHIRQTNYKISIKWTCGLDMAFEKKLEVCT